VLKNAEPDPVTLTQIRINHASSPFTESGAASSNSIYFGAGETKSVSVVSTTFNCVEGRTGTLELSIGYNTQYGTAMTESSDKAFVMKCNMDSDGGATPYTCSGTTQGSCPEGERCCAICTNECPIYVYCSSFHACPTCGLPVCD